MTNKIILVDGNSIINRAFYGVPMMQNEFGERTNAIYGFLSTLFKICDEQKPTHLAIAFDTPAPSFRKGLFSQYKEHRQPMPDDLRPQLNAIKNILNKMHVKFYEQAGFEGDDILGTMSGYLNLNLENTNFEIIILSGDSDLLQLVNSHTKVFMPRTRQKRSYIDKYDINAIMQEFGLTPQELVDMKSIMGDKADNIAGVPGLGIKNATKIIQKYKTLENAIETLKKIKKQDQTKLERCEKILLNYEYQVLACKKLVTIKKDVNIEINLDDMKIKNMFNQEFAEELDKLQIGSFSKRFERDKISQN